MEIRAVNVQYTKQNCSSFIKKKECKTSAHVLNTKWDNFVFFGEPKKKQNFFGKERNSLFDQKKCRYFDQQTPSNKTVLIKWFCVMQHIFLFSTETKLNDINRKHDTPIIKILILVQKLTHNRFNAIVLKCIRLHARKILKYSKMCHSNENESLLS